MCFTEKASSSSEKNKTKGKQIDKLKHRARRKSTVNILVIT